MIIKHYRIPLSSKICHLSSKHDSRQFSTGLVNSSVRGPNLSIPTSRILELRFRNSLRMENKKKVA